MTSFSICVLLECEEGKEVLNKNITSLENLLNKNIKELSKLKNYDYEKFLYSMIHLTSQLSYFYKKIAKNGPTENVFYSRNMQSMEHKLIYINLGRGFPKELMDGHWCYVLKDYGCKLLVIPSTSIKNDSKFNSEYDMDIFSEDVEQEEVIKSRLCITDMRAIDIQRIDKRKKYKKVITKRKEIIAYVNDRIF